MFGSLIKNDSNIKSETHLRGNLTIDKNNYIKSLGNPDVRELASEMMFESAVDKLILGILFDVHRLTSACDLDTLNKFLDTHSIADQTTDHLLNTEKNGLNIFGEEYTSKKTTFVKCPICNKPGYDASKLSAHIASGHNNFKRLSSKEALKRITASQVKDKEDEEWALNKSEKIGKKSENRNKKKSGKNKKQS